jgi:hypothetical protein
VATKFVATDLSGGGTKPSALPSGKTVLAHAESNNARAAQIILIDIFSLPN